jgi:phosphoglucosamine mutase
LEADTVQAAISKGEQRLNGSGRLVIRKSGTEPVIRVMGEGECPGLVHEVVSEICESIERVSG